MFRIGSTVCYFWAASKILNWEVLFDIYVQATCFLQNRIEQEMALLSIIILYACSYSHVYFYLHDFRMCLLVIIVDHTL